MKSFKIEDVKEYMSMLLTGDKFDSFRVYEARIKTALDYYVNGRINKEFYDSEEQEGIALYAGWLDIKHTIYDLIKGRRLPLSFKLILMFDRDNIEKLLSMNSLSINVDDVGALFYNIYYENGTLTITTGSSLKIFSLDKTLDNIWDEAVEKYYLI